MGVKIVSLLTKVCKNSPSLLVYLVKDSSVKH